MQTKTVKYDILLPENNEPDNQVFAANVSSSSNGKTPYETLEVYKEPEDFARQSMSTVVALLGEMSDKMAKGFRVTISFECDW